MKFHVKYGTSENSACGLKNNPDKFIYDIKGFINHCYHQGRCKKCLQTIKDMSIKGFLSLSLMIDLDKLNETIKKRS